MTTRILAALTALTILSGCVEGDAVSWSEIRCHEAKGTTQCLGRPDGSEDAFVFVVRDCQLRALVDSGDLVPIFERSDAACDDGEAYSFFDDRLCFERNGQQICYVGADGWFTQVEPTCSLAPLDAPAWPEWQCGGEAPAIGLHPWDDVSCGGTLGSACFADYGGESMVTWPSCWVDQWQAVQVPAC